jgi:hypothetical protein
MKSAWAPGEHVAGNASSPKKGVKKMTEMQKVWRAAWRLQHARGATQPASAVAKPRPVRSGRGRDALQRSTLRRHGIVAALAVLVSALAQIFPASAFAQADEADAGAWRFRGTLYFWMPGLEGSANLPRPLGTVNFNAAFGDLIDKVNFAVMGELEARKGRWGGFTDIVYMDLSDRRSGTQSLGLPGPGGIVTVPADVAFDTDTAVRSAVWTLAGTYTAIEKPGFELLVLGGLRYLVADTRVDWQATGNIGPLPPVVRAGRAEAKPDYWDAIVGVRGRAALGQSKWFVPYYLDIGTGNSDRTWQASAGIGYSFGRGELTAVYRHLDYRFDSSEPVTALRFSGPSVGFSWRW